MMKDSTCRVLSPRLLVLTLSLLAVVLLLFKDVSAAEVMIITIDPTSQDQLGCGSTESPCASVHGALAFNNLTVDTNSTNNNGSYGLLLKSGLYQGLDNQNVSIPSNVVWINGTGSVVFQGAQFNLTTVVNSTYSYNTTMVMPIFNISSSLAITGVTFSGDFGCSLLQTNVIVVTDSATTSPSLFSFTNVSFTNVMHSPYTLGAPCIYAALQAGSELKLTGVSIDSLSLVWATSTLAQGTCPPTNYEFPVLSVFSLLVSGAAPPSPVNTRYLSYGYIEEVIRLTNVNLVFINTTIIDSIIGLIATTDYNGAGCYQTSMPIALVNNLVVNNSTISGGVSAAVANIFNVSVTNSRIGFNGVLKFFWGDASIVYIVNNTFISVNPQYAISGLVTVGWSWNPCIFNNSGCNQLPPSLPVATYLTGIVIQNNVNLSAFNFDWDSGNAELPSDPFTSSLAVVYISSSVVTNNNYYYPGTLKNIQYSNIVASGVAIEAQTTYTTWQGTSGIVHADNTFFNQIVASNCVFSNNEADGSGGAIFLSSTSLKLINTTVQGNVANLTEAAQVTISTSPGDSCSFSGATYYGGGGIYATYYSQIQILNGSSIAHNQVIGDSVENTRLMGGGIFCCPNANVTVILDANSTIGNNSADLINDLSCRNSSFHSKVPLCNFVGPTDDICEYGETSALPIILISAAVALVSAAVIFVGVWIYLRKKRQYEILE